MSLPWRRGPQIQAPWHHKSHGAVDVVGPITPPGRASGRGDAGVYTNRRKRPLSAVLGHSCTLLRRCGQVRERRSVHRSVKMASRRRFEAFVYTVATLVATRAASGGTSAPTTMTCRRHSLGGHLPLGRENRLCTSGAAARLASSPRQQTHTNPRRAPESNGTLSLRATTRHLDYLDARKSKVSSMLTTRRQAIPGLKAYRQPPAHETIVSEKGA